jgi:hypothetical protein
LLLNVVTVTYAGQREAPPPVSGTVVQRRDHLFDAYVKRMLLRRTAERRYLPELTVHWLSWLADQMVHHGQTVFYLERLQRDWLPPRPRQAVRICNRLAVGLMSGLVLGPMVAWYFMLAWGLSAAFVAVLGAALIGALARGLCVGDVKTSAAPREAIYSSVWSALGIGLVGWLVGGLAGGLIGWIQDGPIYGLFLAMDEGVFVGLGAALARIGFGLNSPADENILCVETVSFSWPRIRDSMDTILDKGAASGLVAHLSRNTCIVYS